MPESSEKRFLGRFSIIFPRNRLSLRIFASLSTVVGGMVDFAVLEPGFIGDGHKAFATWTVDMHVHSFIFVAQRAPLPPLSALEFCAGLHAVHRINTLPRHPMGHHAAAVHARHAAFPLKLATRRLLPVPAIDPFKRLCCTRLDVLCLHLATSRTMYST